MHALIQDLRYGWRMLGKSPGFTGIAILTLALGIGANTAIFSLLDAVMLRSLPVANPSQLMLLKWSARKAPKINGYESSGDCVTDLRFHGENPSGCSFSEPMFKDIAQTNDFSSVTAFANAGRLDLTGNGPAAVIHGQLVSGGFFYALGVKAAAGRVFEPGDDSPSAAPVAVLNYGYWKSAFGGSKSTVGKTIALNGVPFTIVGVADQKFTGLTPGSDYDVWLPLSVAQRITPSGFWNGRQDDVTFWWLTLVGRLKPGVPLARTQAQVSSVFRDEMLHGVVPIFNAGGPRAGPGPQGGAPGKGMMRREVVMGAALPAAGPVGPGGPMPAPGIDNAKRKVFFRAMAVPPGTNGNARGRAVIQRRKGSAKGQTMASEQTAKKLTTLATAADNPRIELMPAQSGLIGARREFENPLYVLMLAVGIILLIACANVAGLMLARSATRRREMAVRLALGARAMRIVGQLLTESVMLAALGGVLGIFLAYWGAQAILSFVSRNQPRALGFAAGLDLRVLGFTIGVSLLTGILFGLAPAFRSARMDLNPVLKEGEGSSASAAHAGGKRLNVGNVLVVAQVALAIVVLVGAGLLVRTLENLRGQDLGFDAHHLVNFAVDPTLAGYQGAQLVNFYRDLQARLAATPGVQSVSFSMIPLLSNGLMMTSFHWPGTPRDRPSEADVLPVGPGFFKTMHIPFLTGRRFDPSDYELATSNSSTKPTAAPTPVIVNQVFVQHYVKKENPIGKIFGESEGNRYGPGRPGYEIIGVVRDAKYNSLKQQIRPTMYEPQSQFGATFELRTAASPQAILPAIRGVVARMNVNLPLYDVTTESQQIDRLLFEQRLIARLSGFFAVLALALACIGLYGLLSYEVTRRTREIGIRMALGAQQGDVLRLIVREGIALALFGAVVGIGVALGVMRFLKTMLYNVSTYDPVTITAVAALLTLVALAACWIPARRAMKVDPMVALRYE